MKRAAALLLLFLPTLGAAAGPGPKDAEARRTFDLAGKRLASADYASARDLYARILLDFPGSAVFPDSLFFLAETERALGDYRSAGRHLDTLLSLYRESSFAEEAALRACEAAARDGRTEEAGRLAEEAARRYPGGLTAGRALRLEADLLLGAGLYEEALAVYPRSLAVFRGLPEEQGIAYSMGIAELGVGRRAEALELFLQARSGASDVIAEKSVYNSAILYAELDRREEYAAALEDLLARFPAAERREDARRLLAGLRDEEGSRTAARDLWDLLCREFAGSPRAPEYLYRRGFDSLALGLWAPSLEDFQRVLRLAPESPFAGPARYGIGVVYARRGEFARALPYFQALAGGAEGGLAEKSRLAVASCNFNLGAYGRALSGFEALARSASGSARGALLLRAARTRYRMQSLAEAALEFRQAASLLTDNGEVSEALFWLGWSWFRLGRLAESRDAFLECAAVSPSGDRAAEAYLRAGMGAAGLGDEAAAVGFYEAAARSAGPDPEGIGEKALYEKGWALVRLGRPAEAAAAFDELSLLYPESKLAADAFFKRATSLLEDRHPVEALALFRRVAGEFPASPLSEQALYWAGEAGLDAGDGSAAVEAFWGYLSLRPDGALAGSSLDGLERTLMSSADVRLARALVEKTRSAPDLPVEVAAAIELDCARLLVSLFPPEALPLIREAAGRGLSDQLAGEAGILLGRYMGYTGMWDSAREIFSGLALAGKGRVAARARLEEAHALEALGNTREAMDALLALPGLFPGYPDLASEALYDAARVAMLRGEQEKANAITRRLAFMYPQSPWAARLRILRAAR